MIRLSICIATMNRAALLRETLDSFLPQLSAEVEIVIVDGASSDNTGAVVSEVQELGADITYLRLDEKGGVDQDFSRAVDLARGEYCWLFSDDDLVKSNAVARVLDVLDHKHSLIVVNGELRNASLTDVLVPNRVGITEDRLYMPEDHEKLFRDTAFYLSFIGGVVIRRDAWLERDARRFAGTEFAHVGVIFQSPLPATALLISEPLIVIRHGNSAWASRTFEIWMFKWPDLIWSFEHFTETSRRMVYRPEPWRSPIALIQYRALGAYSRHHYDRHLAHRLGPVRGLIGRWIAATPARLLNFLSIVYCRLTGSRMALDTLQNCPVYYAAKSRSG